MLPLQRRNQRRLVAECPWINPPCQFRSRAPRATVVHAPHFSNERWIDTESQQETGRVNLQNSHHRSMMSYWRPAESEEPTWNQNIGSRSQRKPRKLPRRGTPLRQILPKLQPTTFHGRPEIKRPKLVRVTRVLTQSARYLPKGATMIAHSLQETKKCKKGNDSTRKTWN